MVFGSTNFLFGRRSFAVALCSLNTIRVRAFSCLSSTHHQVVNHPYPLICRPQHSFFLLRGLQSSSTTTAAESTVTTRLQMFKRARLDEEMARVSDKVIGTHSGTFQADEAMGCWMLRQLPLYRNAKVVRSRDSTVLDPLDIVIDVGGIYDHAKLRYDHHQRGYDERFDISWKGTTDGPPRVTKLSASGLVYRHYGKELIQQFYPQLPAEYLDIAYWKIYDTLLEALDAIDTGVEQVPEGVSKVYEDTTGLSSRVKRLNPRWNEEMDELTGTKPCYDERFERAVNLCGMDFLSVMTVIVESELPARQYVETALLERHETCSSGQIITLKSGGLPWTKHLYELEKIHKIDPLIKFVLYQDEASMWRVQAVTVEGSGFT
jgi:uncharacterized UPF0160 family protein